MPGPGADPSPIPAELHRFLGYFEPRAPRLYRIARAITGSERDAEDLVQETALSAWRSFPTLEDIAHIDAWLRRIVVNHARTLLRTRRRRPEVSMEGVEGAFDAEGHRDGIVAAWPASVEDELDRRRLAARLLDLAGALPATYREIWALADVDQLGTEEIARTLGISPSNVKTRLHRARLALRNLLADELLGGRVRDDLP